MSNTATPAQPVEKKQSATERLTNLENAAQSLFQLNDNLIKDVMDLKRTIKLLDNKVSALAKASLADEKPTDEVLNRFMIENNVDDLVRKVNELVERGMLVKEEQVTDNAFVVGQELDGEDKVLNVRLQFALKALKPEMQEKLLGVKAGDTLLIQENLKFRVLESYKIQPPPAPTPEITDDAPVVAPVASQSSESTPA